VLLARHGATSTGSVRQAAATLATAGAHLVGTVVTQVPRSGGDGYGAYYGSYRSRSGSGGAGTGGHRAPAPAPAARIVPLAPRAEARPDPAPPRTLQPVVEARRTGGAHRKDPGTRLARATGALSSLSPVRPAVTPPALETS
jgi:hypothetical protein